MNPLARRTVRAALLSCALTAPFLTHGPAHALTPSPLFATSVDTMKESRDTETRPLAPAQIATDVNLAARLNTTYITVDTHWDYPAYMQQWVDAIRATGRHVWFRIHPNEWQNNNGTSGIMTPSQYESSEHAFILAHPALFRAGDILDPCPEPENGLYWKATYGSGWTANAPNAVTAEYNAFIRATTDVADAALHQNGIYGVITTVRSTNSFFATHPGALEAATVSKMGRVTVDSYPEGTTTDPQTATNARVGELNAIESLWGVPVVIGEMGYSNKVAVDDATQHAVLSAEFNALAALPYLAGINYWVGAGTDASGGYTHIFAGSNGAWTLRPGGADMALFYGQAAQAANLDIARFNWDDGTTQGWTGAGAVAAVTASTAQDYRGAGALAVSFRPGRVGRVAVASTLAGIQAGTPLAVHVWVAPGASPGPLYPYVVDAGGAVYRGAPMVPQPGQWSTSIFTVPAGATAPLVMLGLAFQANGSPGTFYLDSVDAAAYVPPSGTPAAKNMPSQPAATTASSPAARPRAHAKR